MELRGFSVEGMGAPAWLRSMVVGCFIAWLSCLATARGQTNSIPHVSLFSLPRLELRAVPFRTERPLRLETISDGTAQTGFPRQTTVSEAPLNGTDLRGAGVEGMTLDANGDYFSPGLYREIVRGGYLTHSENMGGVAKFADSVFRPEVVHVGKTAVSCTLITAIKRKNPLCLLNPLFLDVSW